MSSEAERLMSEVQLGIEMEAFLNGPIGRYLNSQAKQEATVALEALKTVNPRELETIIALQQTIARAEKLDEWMAGVIQAGWYAAQQLNEEGA
jgi:hypothetical protein